MAHSVAHHLAMIFMGLTKGAFSLPFWTLVSIIGLFCWDQLPSPWNLLLAFPIFGSGITMGLLSFYELLVAVLSPRWRREHCFFCKSPTNVKKILSSPSELKNR